MGLWSSVAVGLRAGQNWVPPLGAVGGRCGHLAILGIPIFLGYSQRAASCNLHPYLSACALLEDGCGPRS
jgi:hypothetical protein